MNFENRGEYGARRKVGVCEYIMTDPRDPAFRQVTTHVTIVQMPNPRDRSTWTVHRQFVCLPDGALFEIPAAQGRKSAAMPAAVSTLLSRTVFAGAAAAGARAPANSRS